MHNASLTFSLNLTRGRSRASAASKMEHFVIIVNGFQPLTIITKNSILDVAVALDLTLVRALKRATFSVPESAPKTAL